MDKVKQYIETNRERFVDELFDLLRIPSISAESSHKPDMQRCAEFLAAALVEAGADRAATGENPVIVNSKRADFIIGPIGIIAADSLLGEITPAMAVAVGQSPARKLLLPVNHCNNVVVGTQSMTLSKLMDEAVELLRAMFPAPQ